MLCDGFVIGVGRFGLSCDGPVTGGEVVSCCFATGWKRGAFGPFCVGLMAGGEGRFVLSGYGRG